MKIGSLKKGPHLQAYVMGRFAGGFLDDADLAVTNGRISIGRLVRASDRQLLYVYHVVAEGLTRGFFRGTLSTSSKGPMSWTDKSQSFSHSSWM